MATGTIWPDHEVGKRVDVHLTEREASDDVDQADAIRRDALVQPSLDHDRSDEVVGDGEDEDAADGAGAAFGDGEEVADEGEGAAEEVEVGF